MHPPPTAIYTLSLHDALPISQSGARIEAAVVAGPSSGSPIVLLIGGLSGNDESVGIVEEEVQRFETVRQDRRQFQLDRKSTRLNSSLSQISYAVFCLKKKKHK